MKKLASSPAAWENEGIGGWFGRVGGFCTDKAGDAMGTVRLHHGFSYHLEETIE